MLEQVAEEAVGVAFVHRQGGFRAGTEDAGGQGLGEGGDVGFVCGGEVDEAGEVGCYRV